MITLGTFNFDASLGRYAQSMPKSREPKIAALDAPNKDLTIKQFLGKGDREVSLRGVFSGANAQSSRLSIEAMRDAGEAVPFTDGEDSFNVVITSSSFIEDSDFVDFIRFTINLKESE